MKILMTSVFFYPHIGGIESVTEYLADEFTRMGHDVKIITETNDKGSKSFPYEILRNPSAIEFFKAYLWCDVFVHQGISLKKIWPLFIVKRPWFVVYHGVGYQSGILGKIKKCCSYFSRNIAVSETTKRGYGLKNADVILNSYNSKYYRLTNEAVRRDFVYVGKISQSKGVDVLIKAFNKFKEETLSDWTLTFVGGSWPKDLESMVESSPFKNDIIKVGFKYPEEIVEILNQHQVQIVPSASLEAFGVVVLEGMACGCMVIGSDGDGIEEAMGNAGFTFKKGNVKSLADTMERVYQLPTSDYIEQKKLMKGNIDKLSLRNVAEKYIQVFNRKTTAKNQAKSK